MFTQNVDNLAALSTLECSLRRMQLSAVPSFPFSIAMINTEQSAGEQPISEFKSKSGLKRIFPALVYSMAGFRAAWRGEHAFRQEVFVFIIATLAAFILPVMPWERLLMIGVFVLVLIVELINSAIEAVVDRVSLERNSLSKNAKDFGSAAVLLTLMLAGVTWLVILWPLFFGK